MAFDIGAGLSEMGKSVAATAAAYTLEQQKSELEQQKVILADQLASGREEKQRGFVAGESEKDRTFKSGESALTRESSEKIADKQTAAHLGAAAISAGASKYSADLQYKAHTDALTPAEVRTAQWFSKASPQEREAYQTQLLLKAGMPAWAVGGGAGAGVDGGAGALPGDTPPAPTPAKDAVTGDVSPAPDKKPGVTGATKFNDDAFKGVPPEAVATVKAMVEGRAPMPSSFAAAKPYWQSMMALASKYDPSFDQTTWAGRIATRKDFTGGQSAKNVTALNTALGHAGVLTDAFDKLGNSSFPNWNSVANSVVTAFGDDRVTTAQMAISALGSEARKVFAGSGGGGLAELESWEKNFPINGSPTQQKAAMKQFAHLLESRLDSLTDQYNRGMGRASDPLVLLEPKAREVFERLMGPTAIKPPPGTDPQGNGPLSKDGGIATPAIPPADRRAIGAVYDTPTGPAMWLGNGWARVPAAKPPGSLKLPPLTQDDR